MRVVAVAFNVILPFPKGNAFAFGRWIFLNPSSFKSGVRRQAQGNVGPAWINWLAQFLGGLGQYFRNLVQGGQLKRGITPPSGHLVAPVFGTDRHGQGEPLAALSISGFFEHGPIPLKRAGEQRIGHFAQYVFIQTVTVVLPSQHGHPSGAGVVNGSRPESAHHPATVVHGVGQHHGSGAAKEFLAVGLQLRHPSPHHVPQRPEMRKPVGGQGRRVNHLDVDVEMIVVAPRRQLVVFHERPLQGGGHTLRRRGAGLLVKAIIHYFLQNRVGELYLGHRRPIRRPPLAVSLFQFRHIHFCETFAHAGSPVFAQMRADEQLAFALAEFVQLVADGQRCVGGQVLGEILVNDCVQVILPYG